MVCTKSPLCASIIRIDAPPPEPVSRESTKSQLTCQLDHDDDIGTVGDDDDDGGGADDDVRKQLLSGGAASAIAEEGDRRGSRNQATAPVRTETAATRESVSSTNTCAVERRKECTVVGDWLIQAKDEGDHEGEDVGEEEVGG